MNADVLAEKLPGVGANRIAQDVQGADLSRVSGTPTAFINGRRHHGAYDIDHLSRAVRAAGARAKLARRSAHAPCRPDVAARSSSEATMAHQMCVQEAGGLVAAPDEAGFGGKQRYGRAP